MEQRHTRSDVQQSTSMDRMNKKYYYSTDRTLTIRTVELKKRGWCKTVPIHQQLPRCTVLYVYVPFDAATTVQYVVLEYFRQKAS